jgi:hypothetical protein
MWSFHFDFEILQRAAPVIFVFLCAGPCSSFLRRSGSARPARDRIWTWRRRLHPRLQTKIQVAGNIQQFNGIELNSVVDPQPDADPYSDLLFDADPYPTFHLDEDPDPDPSFNEKAHTLEKVLK